MNIALISEHASPLATLGGVDAGGQNVHVAALAVALARLGGAVTVYTRRDDAHLPRRVDYAPGVVVEHIDAGPPTVIDKDELLPWMDEFSRGLQRAWSAQPPAIAHAHFWMSGSATLQATQRLGVPFVQTFHALGEERARFQGLRDTSPRERIEIERTVALHADRIIATASAEAFALAAMGADLKRIAVVPCGVDTALFEASPRAYTDAPVRMLCLSRLVERKGIADVVTAVADLPGTELLIAGGPPRESLDRDPHARRLQSLACDLGVAARVHLLGRIAHDAVPKLMQAVDVFVTYPWYEPFGIVPLEAMACGLPVVAARVGGLIDTVVHGQTGFLVEPRTPRALVEHLRTLQADAQLRRQLGCAGQRRVRKRYDWARIAADTMAVYTQLLRAQPTAMIGFATAS